MEDVSWELMSALEHAFRILSWQDNLRKEEMPPDWMLAHVEELKEWFDEVETYRRQEFENSGGAAELGGSGDVLRNEYADRFN